MPYRLTHEEPLANGLRRVVREELRAGLKALSGEVPSATPEAKAEAIHEARKSIKKVRAIIRLLGAGLGAGGARDNAGLRDAARELAQLRDADVVVKTVDTLLARYPHGLSAELVSSMRSDLMVLGAAVADGNVTDPIAAATSTLSKTLRLVNFWRFGKVDFDLIEAGFEATYRKARRNLERVKADPSVQNFHELRKRVKDHWYHIRLLEIVRPQVLAAREASLRDLQECLGDDHDLAVLEIRIGPESELIPLVEIARKELRGTALALATRLYQQKPKAYIRRMRELWSAWRSEPLPRPRPILVPQKRPRAATQTA